MTVQPRERLVDAFVRNGEGDLLLLLQLVFVIEALHVLDNFPHANVLNVHQTECGDVHKVVLEVVQIECVDVELCVQIVVFVFVHLQLKDLHRNDGSKRYIAQKGNGVE